MIRLLAAFAVLLSFGAPASAATLTGIVVYSSDDFGTPSGLTTLDQPENPEMHLWRTYAAGKWHALAVFQGLPPQSLAGRARPLNAGDFSIFIPLDEGENYFTIVGEPGPITATDSDLHFRRYVVNLYFDGGLLNPGISVTFPRYADPEGSPTGPNRSPFMYSFDVGLVQQRSPGINDTGYEFYDDGFFRVSVSAASLLPEDRFMSIDLMASHGFRASEVSDFVGSIVILVEPSAGGSAPGPAAGAPGGGRSARAGIPGGGAAPAGGAPVVPGFVSPPRTGGGGAPSSGWEGPGAAVDSHHDGSGWVSGDAREPMDVDTDVDSDDDESEDRDGLSVLRNWLQAAVEDPAGSEDDESSAGEGDSEDTAAEATPDAATTPVATPEATAAASPAPTQDASPAPTVVPTAQADGTPTVLPEVGEVGDAEKATPPPVLTPGAK